MSGAPLVGADPELIEREQESAVLDALVDRLRDGGGAVMVRGEAGIGKSVLLQRVRRRAEAQGSRPLVTVGEAIPSDAQRMFAKRMGANTIEVRSSHLAMVSHLADVVRLIEAAANVAAAVK